MIRLKEIKELYDNEAQIYNRTRSHWITGYVGQRSLVKFSGF